MRRRPRAPDERRIQSIQQALEDGLQALSLDGTVRVGPGYGDNIHVRVVSGRFADMPWRDREELIWSILEADVPESDLRRISLLMLESPYEAPPAYEEVRARREELRAEVREAMARYRAQRAAG